MSLEIGILLLIIVALVAFLALEIYPPDTTAFALVVILMVGGFVSPEEGIAGLSNQATVTVLGLMMLSVGLETTGVITSLGERIKRLFEYQEWLTLLILMLIVGTCSAFISTTAVVIVFLRIMIKLSQRMETNLSKILMPLSFAGIVGGSCTLLGTSTNLLVSSIAEDYGLAPFGVFEFWFIGALFFGTVVLYMLLIGRYLIPDRKKRNEMLTKEYAIEAYLTEVVVLKGSKLEGKRINEISFLGANDLDLIALKRADEQEHFPSEEETLQEGDVLLFKGGLEQIARLKKTQNLNSLSKQSLKDDDRLNTKDMVLCEVILRGNSRLIGNSLDKEAIKRDYNAIPLAVRKSRTYIVEDLNVLTLEAGDILLLEVGRANFERFYNLSEFIVLQEHEELATKSDKRYLASLIVLGVVLLSAFDVLPILVSALSGCVAMFLTGCMTLQRAYRRVDWSVFFLLAGVIPLGTAMNNTGASQWLANLLVHLLGDVSPRMLVAVLFLMTALLSGVVSNNATAILIAPIVVSVAANLSLDPRPLLITVMFAANTSYMSPIGYQTNALIYGPGQYRFIDFFKVGGLLTILIWALATLFIPIIYF